jgi:choline monooxygenase
MNTNTDFLKQQIEIYDAKLDIADACTPPSSWYIHDAFSRFENEAVFAQSWIMVAREDQVKEQGQYLATEVCGEPIIVVRGDELRAFYNVCRHHAAEIMHGQGTARALHCPYHGWTYNLDGSLRSTPQFSLARNFDPACNGLKPVRVAVFEKFVFVCLSNEAPDLDAYLGGLKAHLSRLQLDELKFYKRVEYELDCNWKVFVDNYLDGGYHVPILHKDLSTALDYKHYQVESEDRYCLQTCPMVDNDDDKAVRSGSDAQYYWLYPNVMFNFYEGILDTNLTIPISEKRCKVIFDYYFTDSYDEDFKQRSLEMADLVQKEDESICRSVQKGLNSRSYNTGRLSPQKEAGEHLFHRLLHKDFSRCVEGRD